MRIPLLFASRRASPAVSVIASPVWLRVMGWNNSCNAPHGNLFMVDKENLGFLLAHKEVASVDAASPFSALKLYLAGGEGLVLHRDGAVGSQHGDVQLLLFVQRLLVPLLHLHRLKGGDHCHLGVQGRKGFSKRREMNKSSTRLAASDLNHFQSGVVRICGCCFYGLNSQKKHSTYV